MKFKVGDIIDSTQTHIKNAKIDRFNDDDYFIIFRDGSSGYHDIIDIDREFELSSKNKENSAYNRQEDTRDYNVGASDYAKHKIQPWDIWLEYDLNPWDADIIKRVLRTKEGEDRKLDYEKIIHICKERIRQLGE